MARILVVDDDPTLCATLCRVLELTEHSVVTASDGREGLELFRSQRPDLVISDMMMPEIDGAALIREMKAVDPSCRIIALSGSDTAWAAAQRFGWTGWGAASTPPLARARMEGADVTIGKPFEVVTFLEVVRELLSGDRSRVSGLPSVKEETSYHIRPDGRGRWSIHKEGSERPILRASTKEDALVVARRLAAEAKAGRIIVHKGDGTIEQVVSFGGRATG